MNDECSAVILLQGCCHSTIVYHIYSVYCSLYLSGSDRSSVLQPAGRDVYVYVNRLFTCIYGVNGIGTLTI